MSSNYNDAENYCKDCDRSIYGKYHDCDINIENNGMYVMGDIKCYCKITNGKRAEKYPWEKEQEGRRMTLDEAIAILSDMKIDIPVPKAAVTQKKRNVALDMAISALSCSEIPNSSDSISRQAAIDAVLRAEALVRVYGYRYAADAVRELPPVQPEKETAKRVLWTGWKGTRDTRYKCPNCKKPVKNDDVYCHRCGQKLMFPHISFTDYIPGEKQELIVRWDDE